MIKLSEQFLFSKAQLLSGEHQLAGHRKLQIALEDRWCFLVRLIDRDYTTVASFLTPSGFAGTQIFVSGLLQRVSTRDLAKAEKLIRCAIFEASVPAPDSYWVGTLEPDNESESASEQEES